MASQVESYQPRIKLNNNINNCSVIININIQTYI